jgi:ribosome-binding protein aMBF1 (putative translation factor)
VAEHGHRTWKELRQSVAGDPAFRAGYERARRAFEFGEKVRRARESAGMSQAELARKMKTSQSTIARLESGGTEPTLRTLERVCAALDAELVLDLRPAPCNPGEALAGTSGTAV